MKTKFYIRSKGRTVPVYVRVSISREKLFRKKTRFICNSENWHKDKPLQLKLRKLQNEIEESYNEVEVHNDKWIESILSSENNEETVQSQINEILATSHTRKNRKGGFGLSEGRIKLYKSFNKLIDKYQENIPLVRVDAKFARDFQKWLFDKGDSLNTVGKNIELLKTVCRDAENVGKKINPEIKKVPKLSEKKKELVIVTPEEQKKIKGLDLLPYLDNARKWLLLGCMVGQRGGDLLSLRLKDLKEVKGTKFFEIRQSKTGKDIILPIVKDIEWILEDFPHPISLQKLNDYIKLVCKEAELEQKVYGFKRGKKGKPSKTGYFPKWEIIGTHDLRRSFATNFFGKIPTPVLMGITGHSSEETFLKYIGKTSMDKALDFISHFERLS
ncbi:phage integrase SAM-like domain-containing protein [Muricauda sp. CAU 1633]|uniref:tyrosine-type recombinase/integrase n=1 Tax=Allomuricauda sp. CAU 1633 TaxID=2816036 RepID=UPI001A8E8067|nr:phage integrase SAM-like domain-containing protein [Muricauda sp. CAU 1633]MBO0323513.1 phage integrase SAM-like domain-containing protein [Muricauda sp. CAU 1633]